MTELGSQTSRSKSLWPFYREVDGLEFSNPPIARERFDQILAEGLSHYTGPPDLWHNIAITAGLVQHNQAQLAFVDLLIEVSPLVVPGGGVAAAAGKAIRSATSKFQQTKDQRAQPLLIDEVKGMMAELVEAILDSAHEADPTKQK